MHFSQSVQNFINYFENLLRDLPWNDSTICSAFRCKLTKSIIKQIHHAFFNRWPSMFSEFKKAVQQAESHSKLGK